MSTRSAICTVAGDTWRGRYVHSDGYPSHLLHVLLELIERDGVDSVLKRVTEDRYGWSCLNPGIKRGQKHYLNKRGCVVPGYGVAYTTAEGQSSKDEWVTPTEDWGTEWAYVVTRKDVLVLSNEGSWVEKGRVPFGTPVTPELCASLGEGE